MQLSRETIQGVLKANSGRISACADQTPAIKGKTVPVFLIIQRTGHVSRAQVTTPAVRGTPAEGCIVDALRALRFPEFTGDPMNFTLPLRP
ncbi:MAG: AgmX/PglI C-terminal domain-containing protein [Myxococcales bacterium]|nr:AgmX/PglI C-terminal domain-containing protein [Myxococcales bacterium]